MANLLRTGDVSSGGLILAGFIAATSCAAALYVFGISIYRLFFHPIARFPGPRLAALSDLWMHWTTMTGRQHMIILDLHRKYGDVVRVGPNELSFSCVQSFRDIYGHAKSPEKRFLKTEMYDNGEPPRVSTARDPALHAQQRKTLSNAFSAKALRDQESVIQKYIDLFVDKLDQWGDSGRKAINITPAVNWLMFDIIGDLSFGESFDSVADGKEPFWISMFMGALYFPLIKRIGKQFPLLKLVFPIVIPGLREHAKNLETHRQLARKKAQRRIEMGDMGRIDFFSHILKRGAWDDDTIASHTQLLVISGSEPIATALAATMYYLLKNPECLAKLQHEIRSTFTSDQEITGETTSRLEYLNGVIEEGIRLFPPSVVVLARYSPGATIGGHYVPPGVSVFNNGYTMSRDPRYWEKPEAFRPERWIGDSRDERRASQPFSTGPRGCLGINLVYLDVRLTMAKLVLHYDWELESKDLVWERDVVLQGVWKKPAQWIKFHRVTTSVS
ncbi:hypothetical protein J7T55_005012 [Diaporthe amygdali]|uniref:uncharacterized protein n=1 Tax=Phomopsis amygdali TaxID=1214568 RepID=UPI0022FE2531|nr:uncharacterized protein J7T55_005012 [Diaporthe amygdali]KAJ0116066.1 hypothetical protein J7T55_005012 [Diaporthe amygdali]